MSIKRIGVVPVYVNDQDKALQFYVKRLGMEIVRDDPVGPDVRWVQVKPKGVEISQEPTPQPWGMVEVRFQDQDGNVFLLYGPTRN